MKRLMAASFIELAFCVQQPIEKMPRRQKTVFPHKIKPAFSAFLSLLLDR